MSRNTILACILALTCLLAVLLSVREGFSIPPYLSHKTKCFDCETQIERSEGADAVWKAQPAKLFSAEGDAIAQAGGQAAGGYLAKTLRYY